MPIYPYYRWLKSVLRRLEEDIQTEKRRQYWWAKDVSISPLSILRIEETSVLEIGPGSTIGPYAVIDLLRDQSNQLADPSVLRIGLRTAINEFANIRPGGSEILIGSGCLLSQFVSVIGSNHSINRNILIRDQAWQQVGAGVRIGDDVWIGTHAVILPGVSIGTGVVVAAGAVVTRDLPPYSIAAGIPAEIKQYRE